MDLSVCIVNWNTKNLLRKCLKSIFDKTKWIDFEIIIVDNASEDGSVEMLKKEFPQCRSISSKINLGFSRGNNLALRHAKGEYILFLNPDTELKTNALYGMVEFLKVNPKYGAVGCKLLNSDDSIQYACARTFLTPFRQFCYMMLLDRLFPKSKIICSALLNHWDHLDSRNINCLSGACITARKTIIDKLGGFNDSYFMYGEDIELCYKIKEAGWFIYYLASEEIYHVAGASSSKRKDRFFSVIMAQESNYKFMKDNYGDIKAMEFKFCVMVGSTIRLSILALLLPTSLISKRYKTETSIHAGYKTETSIHAVKKYLNLLLWSINIKSAPHDNR